MPPTKKLVVPACGYIVTPIAQDTVRLDVFDDSKEPPFAALVMSSESALQMSKTLAASALQTMPTKRRK